MLPADRDAALLWDMLEACREITEFTAGIAWQDFSADRKLCLAVERCLEIVGVAAGRISETFRDAHPEVPWRTIRGMRNILAHDYGKIDYALIYRTAVEDIPGLRLTLESLLRC